MASTTAQWVFEAAMTIIDELNDNGAADHADTQEYKNKTLFIINILRNELYPYSDTYRQTAEPIRPIVRLVEDFEDIIDLDDYICQTVMPYGLAAHLMLDENPTVAAFCQQRYEELLRKLEKGFAQMSQDIVDVYGYGGGGYYDENGDWVNTAGNGIGFEWTTHW